MFDFLFSDANLPYAISVSVLLALLVLELLGLLMGLSLMDTADIDADIDSDFSHHVDGDVGGHIGDFLHWIGLGRLPLLMVIAIFAAVFGVIGLTVNQISYQIFGSLPPALLTSPFVFVATLPILSRLSRLVAKYFPRDETNSITIDQLVGMNGYVISGQATDTQIAFARVYDRSATQHTVRIMSATGEVINERSHINLVGMHDANTFLATKV